MSFLNINRYEVQVRQTQPEMRVLNIGSNISRAFDGTLRKSARAYKREWSGLETPPITRTEALALQGLLDGRGHTWSFQSASNFLYSSKGAPVSSGTATRTGSGGKFNAYITVAAGATVQWALGYTSKWTLMVWYYTGGSWKHYIIDSAGNKWENGVAFGGSIPFLTNPSGTVILGDTGSGAGQDFDDFVALPFLITSGMASAFGTSVVAFSALPELSITGDIVDSVTTTAFGVNPVLAHRPSFQSGAWDDTAMTLSFGLAEE